MALQENADPQAQLVPSVCQGVLDPRGLLVQLARKAPPEKKAPKALRGEMAFRVPWVSPGLLVPLVLLEKMETRAKLANRDKKAAKVTKEKMVLLVPLVSKDQLVPLELLEAMESQVPEDSRACLDKKATREREVSLDLLGP